MKQNFRLLTLTFGIIALSTTASAVPVEWTVASGGNGHFYDSILPQVFGPTWFEADAAAQGLTYLGQPGYLLTITSAAENAFILTALAGQTNNRWIGGFQPAGAPEPANGWQWVTGEGGPVAPNFTNWTESEPNDGNGGPKEDGIVFTVDLKWNDLPRSTQVSGFLVEFGAVDSGVPEPATFALTALGLIAAGIARRRARV